MTDSHHLAQEIIINCFPPTFGTHGVLSKLIERVQSESYNAGVSDCLRIVTEKSPHLIDHINDLFKPEN